MTIINFRSIIFLFENIQLHHSIHYISFILILGIHRYEIFWHQEIFLNNKKHNWFFATYIFYDTFNFQTSCWITFKLWNDSSYWQFHLDSNSCWSFLKNAWIYKIQKRLLYFCKYFWKSYSWIATIHLFVLCFCFHFFIHNDIYVRRCWCWRRWI